jgi:hypothetical protein
MSRVLKIGKMGKMGKIGNVRACHAGTSSPARHLLAS